MAFKMVIGFEFLLVVQDWTAAAEVISLYASDAIGLRRATGKTSAQNDGNLYIILWVTLQQENFVLYYEFVNYIPLQ